MLLASLCHLAAAQWTTGDRSAAQLTLDRATDVAATGEARALMVQTLEELQARIGRAAATTAHYQGALVEELTDRELAILRARLGPLSAREIGAKMYLSINTVKSYTKSLPRSVWSAGPMPSVGLRAWSDLTSPRCSRIAQGFTPGGLTARVVRVHPETEQGGRMTTSDACYRLVVSGRLSRTVTEPIDSTFGPAPSSGAAGPTVQLPVD